jgi:membrane-associated protease RseP (regulator of RpoE activity)
VVPRSSSESLRTALTFPQNEISVARWALHWCLLGLTLITTTIVGVVFAEAFKNGRLDVDQYVGVYSLLVQHPALLLEGIPFSLTLLTILLAHEMGHYFASRYYGIDASLPYFLPAPSPLPIGTLGAFIRIRSPIYTLRALFDVGIAGPLAGFVMLLPALIIGVAQSKVVAGPHQEGDLIFGAPAILQLLEKIFFPGVKSSEIMLHPVARAAWAGMLATALNLFPIGQLDGGHILYAFVGRRHKLLSRCFLAALVTLALVTRTWSWLVWAGLLFFFALRHPTIFDDTPLDRNRVLLGIAALAVFLLTFTLVPIH